MAWTASRIFTQFVKNPGLATLSGATKPTGFTSITADALKAALFNNSITPNGDDTLANSAYNAGQFANTNEVTSTNWPAGGETLGSLAIANSAGTWSLTAANTAGDGLVTLANVYGDIVYDSSVSGGTVANQGIGYHYYGGAQAVTGGTFTIVWSASGVIEFTN